MNGREHETTFAVQFRASDGVWRIVKGERTVATFRHRARAIYPAVVMAQREAPSELSIFRKDGTLFQVYHYTTQHGRADSAVTFDIFPEGTTQWRVMLNQERIGSFCSKE